MEASGSYYIELATYLHEKGVKVSVVNPLVIKRYSQMKMIRPRQIKRCSNHCQLRNGTASKTMEANGRCIIQMQQIDTLIPVIKQLTMLLTLTEFLRISDFFRTRSQ